MRNLYDAMCTYCRKPVAAGEGYVMPRLWRDKQTRVRHRRRNGQCVPDPTAAYSIEME